MKSSNQIKALLLGVVVFSVMLLLTNCEKEESNQQQTNPLQVSLTKAELKPEELALIEVSEDLDESQPFEGSIETENIDFQPNNNYLIFKVPSGTPGQKNGEVTVNGETLSFQYELVANSYSDPEVYVEEYLTEQATRNIQLENLQDAFIADSIPGFEDIAADRAVWDQIAQDAAAEVAALSPENKAKLAQLIDANREWMQRLDDALMMRSIYSDTRATRDECKAVIDRGRQELTDGKTFSAAATAVEAYWCALTFDEKQYEEIDNDMERGVLLLQDVEFLPGPGFLLTLTNMVGRKIDALTKELQGTMSSNGVADDILEVDNRRSNEIPFGNGDPEPIFTKIRFRSINQNDIDTEGEVGEAANFFDQVISNYNAMVEASSQPLIWRPGFTSTSTIKDFNQFLTIPEASVSNGDIVLITTQYRNETWEVAFGNDGNETEPTFEFDLQYNDGYIELEKTVSAKISDGCKPCNGQTTFTDPRDGKTYDLVEIGCQCWFAENLNYSTGSSACYDNDNANCNVYGKLYDYWSANSACPSSTHLPSSNEWQELIAFLGGESVAGGKMKTTTLWNAPNTGADNASGFTGLPGGNWTTYPPPSGSYGNMEALGYWWTSDQTNVVLRADNENVGTASPNLDFKFSCRCILD